MYVQILARTFAISRKKKRVEKRVGKKWLAIKVFGVLLHVVGWCKGLANFQHRLSPRWNALVDWHSMLRLKGLMYCRWRTGMLEGRPSQIENVGYKWR